MFSAIMSASERVVPARMIKNSSPPKRTAMSFVRLALCSKIWAICFKHVEDDEDICKLVDMLLGEKFKMNQAGSLAEAKKLLSENCYDLLLLDIGLPDGSGLDLIEYIRTLSKTPEVVIFSADDIKINQKMPVAETLVKSRTTNNELVEKIEKIVTKNN